jgi:hypothetical protein
VVGYDVISDLSLRQIPIHKCGFILGINDSYNSRTTALVSCNTIYFLIMLYLMTVLMIVEA